MVHSQKHLRHYIMTSNTRYFKRKQDRLLKAIVAKAKADTQAWMLSLTAPPSEAEIKAFQAGYIAGVNHGSKMANK